MKNRKIFIAEKIAKEGIEILEKKEFIPVYDIENAYDAEGIFIWTYTKITKEFLDQFPNLSFILRAGVGLENVDLIECKKRNIQVFNSPGSNANSVAEYLIMVFIYLLRKMDDQRELIEKGKWRNEKNAGQEVKGKTIGLIGCGAIGKLVARKLENFDVSILGYDPFIDKETLVEYGIEKKEFSEVLQQSDIVSLQLPLTSKTQGMFGIKEFKQMKKTAYFINISRGALIKEDDMIEALNKKYLAGAALDVFLNEPKINSNFIGIKNIFVTPHIAGITEESLTAMAVGAVKNFLTSYKENI